MARYTFEYVRSYPHFCLDGSFDCSTVARKLKEEYHLLSQLPYTSMYKQLYAKNVITQNDKVQIQAELDTEKMAKLLDIIITSLNLDQPKKYLDFLKAMEESEDLILQQTAKRLGK